MNYSIARRTLLGGVSLLAASAALPTGAHAQATTCSQSGTTISCIDGAASVFSATTTPSTTVQQGAGLTTVSTTGPSTISYVATAPLSTSAAPAVTLISTGGALSFTPSGNSAPVAVSTSGGVGANGVTITTTGQPATVTVGNITTTGAGSTGLLVRTGTGAIDAGYGSIATSGVGTPGNSAGAIDMASSGSINLRGSGATLSTSGAGVAAATVNGARVTGNLGNVATTGAAATGAAITASDAVNLAVGTVSTTGAGSTGLSVNTGGSSALNATSITTRAGDGVVVQSGGDSTTTVGTVSIAGNTTRGVAAQSAAGNVTVALANGSATGSGSTLVSANSGSGSVTASSTGMLSASGAASRVADLSAGGNVTGTFANVTASGVGSSAIVARSGGATALTISGNVSDTATGTGFAAIDALSGGGLTVTNNGAISTTGAGVNGITAQSTAGPVSVAGTGSISTTGTGALGVRATTGATGNAVTVAQGSVSTSGLGSTGVLAQGTGATSVTLGSGITTGTGARVIDATGRTVTIATTGSLSAAGADTVVATSTTGTTLANSGTITAGNGSALVITGGAATIANSGSITGPVVLTANDDVVGNSGSLMLDSSSTFGAGKDTLNNSGTTLVRTVVDFGAGTDVVNNSGTFGLVPRGAPLSATLTGLETFNNSGTVTLQNGIAGDTLTVPGTFNGSGSSNLLLDVDPSGNGLSDRLVVGGAATGSTQIGVNFVNGNAVFTPGITLVTTGSGSAANAFTIAPTTVGLVTYGVAFNGANNTFSLVGAPSGSAIRLVKVSEGAQSLWHDSADAVSAELTTQRDAAWSGVPANGGRLWLQMFGHVATRKQQGSYTAFGFTQNVDSGYRQDAFGVQAGFGLLASGALTVGVTGGYINSNLKFSAGGERVRYNAVNGGIYAGYNSGAFFLNGLAKYDHYRIAISDVSGALSSHSNGDSYGAKGEAGFRFGGSGFYAEPNVSIAYVRTNLDTIALQGVTFEYDRLNGLRGTAGMRIGSKMAIGSNSVAILYAAGDYVHEFRGKNGFVLTSGGNALRYGNLPIGDYGRGKVGVAITSGAVTGFIEGNGIAGKSYKGGGGRAGIRVAF